MITSADNGKNFSDLKVSTVTGECVSIIGASDVTIKASDIGPCGEDNSSAASNGIHVSGSNGIKIYDNYIHVETRASGCCDSHDDILVDQGSTDTEIQGNVIAFGESNIELQGANGPIKKLRVIGNFFLNPQGDYPRGHNFQSWSGTDHNSQITIADNYSLSCTVEAGSLGVQCPIQTGSYYRSERQQDAINMGFTDSILVENNWISGGHSSAGCGIVLDEATNGAIVQQNVLSNTGQCGIGVAGGSDHVINQNKILNLRSPENVGLYIWNQYPELCERLTISNNISSVLASDSDGCDPHTQSCNYNGFSDFGNCASVTDTTNNFDNGTYGPGGGPAFRILYPISSTSPPPLIPPKPKYCVTRSPFSTQTSMRQCADSTSIRRGPL